MENHIRFDQDKGALILLDQRLLPAREEYLACRDLDEIIHALREMVVRGAPAIGVCAAYGCLLALRQVGDQPDWEEKLDQELTRLAEARPTAVNLAWAVERMRKLWKEGGLSGPELDQAWLEEARTIHRDDRDANHRLGRHGATLLNSGDTVMTHCNAGALATAGYGTALGVIYAARQAGLEVRVIANETRPFLQGARLTAYELHRAGIPVTVACDNACAFLMSQGRVQKVIVGADRIAANGDTANKIGTYGVALLARQHNIPFYVAAPTSTIDRTIPDGTHIPIEQRPEREVSHVGETRLTPEGVPVFNFAFDVTPAWLISAIITEQGVLFPPYAESIARLVPPV